MLAVFAVGANGVVAVDVVVVDVLAVCGARSGNSDAVSKNLSSAFSMESDIDLKNKAVNDLEFRSYSDAVQAAMN